MNGFWDIYLLIGLAVAIMAVAYMLAFPEQVEVEVSGLDDVHPMWIVVGVFSACLWLWPIPLALVLQDMNNSDGPWRG